ncbi:MAG: transcription termination/antitermination protein NusG [Campylobacteraceae bacterium 4484_166]|nr:MAG: transcription termination/antitermination protein NusG [Campylobacteraceae bacterium 4484_166]
MSQKWYAIQTHSGSEKSVKNALLLLKERLEEGKIDDILVPTEDLIEVKNGKKIVIEKPLYSAYVFAKLDLDTQLWHTIQSMPKVGRFIGESKQPTPLSDKDIQSIMDKVQNRSAPRPKVEFNSGETVRIKEGSFANFNGIVESFDLTSGILKLNVSIFGRNTPVTISYLHVELID